MTLKDCFTTSIVFGAVIGLGGVIVGQAQRDLFTLLGGIGLLLFSIYALIFYIMLEHFGRTRL